MRSKIVDAILYAMLMGSPVDWDRWKLYRNEIREAKVLYNGMKEDNVWRLAFLSRVEVEE